MQLRHCMLHTSFDRLLSFNVRKDYTVLHLSYFADLLILTVRCQCISVSDMVILMHTCYWGLNGVTNEIVQEVGLRRFVMISVHG